MRVCVDKQGKLIEAQGGGSTPEHLDTLLQNAISAGYKVKDIEVKFVTDQEFAAIVEASRPTPTQEKIGEMKIEKEMRKLAVKSLKDKGEWSEDYKE